MQAEGRWGAERRAERERVASSETTRASLQEDSLGESVRAKNDRDTETRRQEQHATRAPSLPIHGTPVRAVGATIRLPVFAQGDTTRRKAGEPPACRRRRVRRPIPPAASRAPALPGRLRTLNRRSFPPRRLRTPRRGLLARLPKSCSCRESFRGRFRRRPLSGRCTFDRLAVAVHPRRLRRHFVRVTQAASSGEIRSAIRTQKLSLSTSTSP